VDPFLLRGASLGAAWRAERGGAHGAVYHAVGAGTLPIASGLPLVVTLLDLAPWEMPGAFRGAAGARFGRRLRAQQLREAAAVIVGTEAVARAARRLLRIRRERLHVVAAAPRPAFVPGRPGPPPGDVERLGLVPGRYLVYAGRYDVRQDLATLLRALAGLIAGGRPGDLAADVPWPPRVLLVGATPDDRAALARSAAAVGADAALAYAPPMGEARVAALLRASRAALLPVVSEAVGLAAIEALATGTPIVASAVGALPEIVATAGLLVEPRDVDRLATALRTVWLDDGVHGRIAAAAAERATGEPRTWADVADGSRRVYAAVGLRP
jgi:D-inositol-3-phosphate glycosyltransferase